MNILTKIITALRGGLTEAGEAVIDSQALRILDQEVRDASEELKKSKDGLAEIMARQKVSEEKCNDLKAKITEHEGYAVKALEKNDEGLAREVATKIADMENQLSSEQAAGKGYADSAAKLRVAIKQADANIKRLRQQADTVKATASVQRAQVAVAERHSGSESRLQTAMDSLERIKEKQALKAAQINAANELAEETSDSSLQSRLEEAGIVSSSHNADDVLARIKANKEAG